MVTTTKNAAAKAAPKKTPAVTAAKTKRAAKASPSAKPAKSANAAKPAKASARKTGAAASGLRVRMYRVGFGDFFLITVPTVDGPRHILVDCGVHAGNIGCIGSCVEDLAELTGGKLALVIVTHYHADHLSGFASQAEKFQQFEVDAVWITNRLDPKDGGAMKITSQISALASRLRLQLAARFDEVGVQALAKAENALGAAGSSNDTAMAVVTSGFKNTPPVYYYEAGQEPTLPPSLQGAVFARILGPAPKQLAGQFSASDNKAEQYLAAVGDLGPPSSEALLPFEPDRWPSHAEDYPPEAFKPWTSHSDMESVLKKMQPDVLAAAAEVIDGTLNNQSLVVLFTCLGKKLLFVGDAQWGNWAHWLYGKPVKGADPGITAEAKEILGSIDFYKVGHHGSTNATPIPAAGAMRLRCVGMCSTQMGCYGSVPKKTEVPRIALMEALEKQTGSQLIRSDWISACGAAAADEAHQQLERLPPDFETGDNYIDYVFPAG